MVSADLDKLGSRRCRKDIRRGAAVGNEAAADKLLHGGAAILLGRRVQGRIRIGNGRDQPSRMGVGGRFENLAPAALFHDLAEIHDQHPVAHMLDHAKIMADLIR